MYSFRIGERLGGLVAHQELIRAALASGSVHQVHLFRTDGQSGNDPAVAELCNELGAGLLEQRSILEFPLLSEQKQYLFLSSAPRLGTLSELRTSVNQPFPICGILHSAHWDRLLSTLCSVILSAEPYDVLIAPSEA